ncbi:hypothetical protein NW762_012031 [Fusarium torreyae]|uniref:Uncharacterized protein n=1 Tax=Fusarium torreyae TaxID=1237075 RepID=A0A9W8RQ59_9HYPO|nr:hypothetical protein NW762_012031 [Fusarium torreyae]
MFVYQGKLNFLQWAQDEPFVIVLPTGVVRPGDNAYISSQWTETLNRRKNINFFEALVVDKVTKTEDGGDSFQLASTHYKWDITAGPSYEKLNVSMSNLAGERKKMDIDRVYHTKGPASKESSYIWTGYLKWQQTAAANQEPVTVIVPEGLGADKPALALWQWTKASNGKQRVPYVLNGIQKVPSSTNGTNGNSQHSNGTKKETQTSRQAVQFNFEDDSYHLACSWDRNAEKKLDVRMKEVKATQTFNVGPFDLQAIITPHSHDLDPPEIPLPPAKLEVRYPQAKPALDRLQKPMPFPRTLVDTLTFSASFIDHAGYLAKYAVEKYNILDSKVHIQDKELDERNKKIHELANKIKGLNIDVQVGKDKSVELEQKLVAEKESAKAERAELRVRIENLLSSISEDAKSDAQERQRYHELENYLKEERELNSRIQEKLIKTELELADAGAENKSLSGRLSSLNTNNLGLQHDLDVVREEAKELQKKTANAEDQVVRLKEELDAKSQALDASERKLKSTKDEAADNMKKKREEIEALDKLYDYYRHEYNKLEQLNNPTNQTQGVASSN